MPFGRSLNVTFGCSSCHWEHALRTWAGEPLWALLRHMTLLGWHVELAPTIRLWCPVCAAKKAAAA